MQVAWVEVEGRAGKFYHTSDKCKAQLPKNYAVEGDERDARRKGVALCPDCEKVTNGSDR